MKIAVIITKYGEQINLKLPEDWDEHELSFINRFSQGNIIPEKFIEYFIQETKNTVTSYFYFEHIYLVDTNNLINPSALPYSKEYYKSDPLNKFKMYGKEV